MIKLVAFDMDGTFLNDENDYDRERFERVFQDLMARGIKVVAISGNQHAQIRSFFKDYVDEMTIVSEGGGQFYEQGLCFREEHFEPELLEELLSMIEEKGLSNCTSLSGLEARYILSSADQWFKEMFAKYSFSLVEVGKWTDRPQDPICQITLNLGEQDVLPIVEEFNRHGKGRVRAVTSGNGFMDLTLPDVNKGTAMAYLGERWRIQPDEMMAFGDSGNDLEMLRYVGYSYAMKGSPDYVYEAAKFEAPSNQDSGVLAVIEERILHQKKA
ncbi:Cof-type HAD-IIB family hydrolase [Streptococcus sp. DD13]|uniref:Cof-type HAD-IIB family hydrolase n=1 Tax=Streptococcus sp. DD13 TaxID=1777881 RepID=UPI00079BA863|nr:Cof-type HAD-IIB family hydrolase [Streptococcus sp. DD13]KXT77962.1 Hydrolase (HAD superfamily) [Streptococcus sp. DD13]